MILEEEYKTVLEGKIDTCNCINCNYNIVEIFTKKIKKTKDNFRVVLSGTKERLHLNK
jgi:hypothetical protein